MINLLPFRTHKPLTIDVTFTAINLLTFLINFIY